MKNHFNPGSLRRSVMSLFGTNKSVNAPKLYGNKYYRQIFFEKNLFDGIKWLADTRHISIKQEANELMAKAFSDTINDLIYQQADLQIAERYIEKNRDIVRFIMAFRKLAKEKGVNIDQIVPPIQTRPKKPKQ